MDIPRPAAALLLLLALAAGDAGAEPWTVRSPAIQSEAQRAERDVALAGIAASAIVFWARRRRR
ncbi:MAG TPA: hypothetical protein VH309_14165 [Elusimicrobiota bacterium]|jgi:hypothetical protein|nr:hypothetical protein [Elusimicrobiota bacterium]